MIEFNGDDLGEVAEKKASVDLWMRDAYEAFYNSGCDQLTLVHQSAYGRAVGQTGVGTQVIAHAIVLKTKMTREVAESVNWTNKETLNFDEIWDTMIVNRDWMLELQETGE